MATQNPSIKYFLKQNKKPDELKEIVVSDSFVDENGKPIAWKIRPITSYEEKRISESKGVREERKDKRTGNITVLQNDTELLARIAAQAVVFPDLGDRELQDSYSTELKKITTKVDLLREMLDAGQVYQLATEVSKLSHLNIDDEDDYERDLETAKN